MPLFFLFTLEKNYLVRILLARFACVNFKLASFNNNLPLKKEEKKFFPPTVSLFQSVQRFFWGGRAPRLVHNLRIHTKRDESTMNELCAVGDQWGPGAVSPSPDVCRRWTRRTGEFSHH